MICLCLSLSKQQNPIIVLGLSVQQHFIWVQFMQLELTMFDTSNNKFSIVPLSCRNTKFPLLKLICCSNPSLIHMNILTLNITLANMRISFTTNIWKQPSSRYNQARRTPWLGKSCLLWKTYCSQLSTLINLVNMKTMDCCLQEECSNIIVFRVRKPVECTSTLTSYYLHQMMLRDSSLWPSKFSVHHIAVYNQGHWRHYCFWTRNSCYGILCWLHILSIKMLLRVKIMNMEMRMIGDQLWSNIFQYNTIQYNTIKYIFTNILYWCWRILEYIVLVLENIAIYCIGGGEYCNILYWWWRILQ